MRDDAVAGLRSTLFLAGSLLLLGADAHRPKNVVVVTAHDFAIELPATISPGVTTFQLVNRGKLQHHVSIVRLDDGHTPAEALKAIMDAGRGPRPAWIHPAGGPQAVAPGRTGNATLVLEPGRYLAFCEVPGPDPVPHFMKGMAKGFTVSGATNEGAMPRGDVALSLTDFDFTFTKPLTKGRHVVAVTNNGTQPHMVVLTRLPAGQDSGPWMEWAQNPKGKLAPGHPMGGAAEIVPGGTTVFTGDFPPGHYFMVCFTPDAKDGKPHFMHGMQKEFDVR